MMYTAHRNTDTAPICISTGKPGYKPAHTKHPMTLWVGKSRENYSFSIDLATCLSREYTRRYKKLHACNVHIQWLSDNQPEWENTPFTKPPQCMPDIYKEDNPVQAYRNFYIHEKSKFAQWKYTDTPKWFHEGIQSL